MLGARATGTLGAALPPRARGSTPRWCLSIPESTDAEANELSRRAAVHAALGDPGRLAIVDALVLGEASPSELQKLLDMPSNLMAHHVRVLERAGCPRAASLRG